MELNTALKPTFLKSIFKDSFSHVIYLDPDILVTAPLSLVIEAMDTASITLIPHAVRPILDGFRPSDIDFLRAGSFNLGFIALRQGAQASEMLNWWEERCLGLGFNDPNFGTFVDQKWIDLVPCYFDDVKILKHPGCNVAYWNLHEREITRNGSIYEANKEPLVFFHFSGVSAYAPNVLSKHQTRHSLQLGSPLADLVAHYCQSLLSAGHKSLSTMPYSFGRLDDGTPITPIMRRALCSVYENESAPFSSASQFQRKLVLGRITTSSKSKTRTAAAPTTTLNFDQSEYKVRVVNALIRLAARVIGVPKLNQILRYTTLMTREAHLPAVLLKEPLKLKHLPYR